MTRAKGTAKAQPRSGAKARAKATKKPETTAVAPARSRRSRTLAGSCQCGKVSFTVDSETPVPFMFCFCSICRKTSGGAFGCNVMGIRQTLKLRGKRYVRAYHARVRETGKPTVISEGQRWFCAQCGSHLYLTDDRWPNGIWPNVGVIDTPLPRATEHVFLMLRYKPKWVDDDLMQRPARFPRYPRESIAGWHEKHGWPVTIRP